jgi:hypothetical protein
MTLRSLPQVPPLARVSREIEQVVALDVHPQEPRQVRRSVTSVVVGTR